LLVATKLLKVKLHTRYIKESGVGVLVGKFGKVEIGVGHFTSDFATLISAIQPYTFSARLLYDGTFALPDVVAIVNCPVVALNVFYSTVVIGSLIFLQL